MEIQGLAEDKSVHVEGGAKTLATIANLERRGVQISTCCLFCDEVETAEHMLFGCSWAREVWTTTFGNTPLDVGQTSVDEWLKMRIAHLGRGRTDMETAWNLCMIICWQLWKSHCQFVFQNRRSNVMSIVREIIRNKEEMASLGTGLIDAGSQRKTTILELGDERSRTPARSRSTVMQPGVLHRDREGSESSRGTRTAAWPEDGRKRWWGARSRKSKLSR